LLGNDGNSTIGLGLIVSDNGMVLVDKSITALVNGFSEVLSDGTRITLSYASTQPSNPNMAYLIPNTTNPKAPTYKPISFAATANLGQTILNLSGTSTPMLSQGIITQAILPTSDGIGGVIVTSIPSNKVLSGSPLFTPGGDVVGISLSSATSPDGAVFYPITGLKSTIPTN
jgi:hypothetical protein